MKGKGLDSHRHIEDAETQRKPKFLCVSESLWLVIVIIVATMISVAAQIRPTPQAPPRRTAPPPKTAPQPKRESPEPDDKKPADRGSEGSAPQATPPQREPQPSALQVSSDPKIGRASCRERV